jgi:amino acid transporter
VLVVVGFTFGTSENLASHAVPAATSWLSLIASLATVMMVVLWTYSGWQEAAYVVAEIKDRHRNIPWALLLGTAFVTVIYVVVNAAYVYGLGFTAIGMHQSTFAADMLALALPGFGAKAMAMLVIVSALGAINGMIFTTARIYAEFGLDHRLFAPLSHWSRRWGTPARALIVQGIITLVLIAGVSLYEWWNQRDVPLSGVTVVGLMSAPDGFVQLVANAPLIHASSSNTFNTMLEYTAAVFWFFFLLTGLAFFVLRRIDGDLLRPFRVPLYPYIPVAFCGWCAGMTIGVILEQPLVSLVGLGMVLVGLPFYYWPQKRRRQPAEKELEPVAH